jgi:general transcriptional corepressor TUP1
VQDPSVVGHDAPNGSNGHNSSVPGGPAGGLPKRLVQLPSSTHGFGPSPSSNGAGGLQSGGHGQNSPTLMGISSLPSATHTPSLPPVGPGGPRLMSAIDPTPIKKDNVSSMPLGGPASAQHLMSNDMVAVPAGISPGAQQAGDEDYVVYHGRAPNGAMVPMKVSLQSSLPHDSVVCCVRYSWDGDYLATGSNRSAHIFDVNSGQRVAVFSKDDGTDMDDGSVTDSYVRAVCFSRDGNWLITGAEDHVVKVWDVRNRTVKHKLVGHDTDIYSVDASANGAFIISGSGDKKAKLWSLESGKLLSTLGGEYGPTDGITSVSISPTSQHVAAGSLDKTVRVWDVESSRLVRQFEGHRDSVYSVAFSPDGLLLLSGSLDKTLKLWDLGASRPSQQCRLTFTGHKDFVLSVCFSPDGRWLISGSKDRTVQFWDPRQPSMCVMLQGHKNSVISIAHNPASMSLATGSGDCRARVWNFGPG